MATQGFYEMTTTMTLLNKVSPNIEDTICYYVLLIYKKYLKRMKKKLLFSTV